MNDDDGVEVVVVVLVGGWHGTFLIMESVHWNLLEMPLKFTCKQRTETGGLVKKLNISLSPCFYSPNLPKFPKYRPTKTVAVA